HHDVQHRAGDDGDFLVARRHGGEDELELERVRVQPQQTAQLLDVSECFVADVLRAQGEDRKLAGPDGLPWAELPRGIRSQGLPSAPLVDPSPPSGYTVAQVERVAPGRSATIGRGSRDVGEEKIGKRSQGREGRREEHSLAAAVPKLVAITGERKGSTLELT